MAIASGEVVTVEGDTAKLEKRYFGRAKGDREGPLWWTVTSVWNTNTEGWMANLTRVGSPKQRRQAPVGSCRPVEMPSALS